jgi:CRP-like cAMP-binding protein
VSGPIDETTFVPMATSPGGGPDEATDDLHDPHPFAAFDRATRRRLFAIGSPRSFAAGEIVVHENAPSEALFVLLSGSVETVLRLSGDATRRLEVLRAPGLIGEAGFIDGAPRSATVRALTACEARRLDRRQADRLATEDPELARSLMLLVARALCGRLRRSAATLSGRVL